MNKASDKSDKKDDKKEWVDFFKANWLGIALALVGLVLVVAGVVMMSREEAPNLKQEIVIEEAEEEKIVVDIQGAVLKPDVYTLSSGSRVADLLIAAGGLSQEADREWVAKNLNRAKKLADGEKFYIPKKNKGKVAGTSWSKVININTASLATLESLPGIGKMRAQKIVEGRPYGQVEELLEKEVVSAPVFEKIKDKISVW